MRLTHLSIENFLGYEVVDLDFSELNDVVVVGHNGAGKSALFDAITWALFDSVHRPSIRASSDRVIRDGADLARVAVEFTAGGHVIEVRREKPRSKTGTLALTVDGEQKTKHTTAETFEAIEKYVGLSFAGLLAGPFMVQKSSNSFMAMQPRERKDLLIGLLGLDVYERLYDAARRCVNEYEASRSAAERRIADLQAVIAASDDLPRRMADARAVLDGELAEVERRVAEVSELQVTEATANASAQRYADITRQIARLREGNRTTEMALADARAKVARYEQGTPRPPDPTPEPSLEEIAEAEGALQEARKARETYIRAESAREAAAASLARAQSDSELVDTVPCQTLHRVEDREACLGCQFLTNAVGARETIPTIVQRMDDAEREATEAKALADATPERAAVVDRIRSRREQAVDTRAALALWEEREAGRALALTTAQTHVAHLESQLQADSAELERLLDEVEPLQAENDQRRLVADRLEQARASVISAKRRAQEAEEPVRQLAAEEARLASAKESVETEKAAQEYATEQANTYRILSLAFHRDGIPTNIIETALPMIEGAANEVLERLPGDMRLAIVTQREKATGGMLDRLDVVVTTDGWERDYGLLSVGQRFRVDLALRLGLSRVLSQRSGTTVDTLWLDEPLADLDAEAREAVIETLGAVTDEFGLTVVISHHPEFNDHFSSVLNVSMDGGVSTAMVA